MFRPSTAVMAPPLARTQLFAAMGVLAVVLTVFSNGYGFHRDELYFRMLEPAWGYVDQPPLTPLLVRVFSGVADEPWAIRIPATLCVIASLAVLVLITRELGGGTSAQTICAWGYASASSPLLFGHVMLTATLDLLVWPAVSFLVIRALLRNETRWWLLAGLATGLSLYNKLLIVVLVAGIALGIAVLGPREICRLRAMAAAAGIAVLVGLPNIVYQASHDWPQLTMGAALSENNAGDVRVMMWPFLILLLGPPLLPIWIAGLVALIRRADWRPVRGFVVAFAVVLAFTFVSGSQFYYPVGVLTVLFAAGCVPAADWLARSRPWRITFTAGVVVNAVVSVTIALPLIPVGVLGDTPVPGINQTARDSVGWPTYVSQVGDVWRSMPPADQQTAVIIASNYGEAGAVARYGPALGLPAVYSGHNELYFQARPPDSATVVIMIGQLDIAENHFASCESAGSFDDQQGVDNEEQDTVLAVCRTPLGRWDAIWPAFQHYD